MVGAVGLRAFETREIEVPADERSGFIQPIRVRFPPDVDAVKGDLGVQLQGQPRGVVLVPAGVRQTFPLDREQVGLSGGETD